MGLILFSYFKFLRYLKEVLIISKEKSLLLSKKWFRKMVHEGSIHGPIESAPLINYGQERFDVFSL